MNAIDGRKTKKRFMWNRGVIFLCDIEPFLVQNDWLDSIIPLDDITQEEYDLTFGWLDWIMTEEDENELFSWEIFNSDNTKDFLGYDGGNRTFHYEIEQQRYEKYWEIEHIQDIYAYDFFFASSIYGSIAPHILYIDNQYSINKWNSKREAHIWLIKPLYLHIKKQKSYHNRQTIMFASKHRSTHYLQFLYNVAEKNEAGYYDKPEYVLVRTKVSDFRMKKTKNDRWEDKQILTIFTNGNTKKESDFVMTDIVVDGNDVSWNVSNRDWEDSKMGVDKKMSVKNWWNQKSIPYDLDSRIANLKEFSLWKCKDVRLMTF